MTHIRASNTGAALNGAAGAGYTMYEEMRAYDQLGPCCRKVIAEAIYRWSAVTTLREHKRRGQNPLDPHDDMTLAMQLRAIDQRQKLWESKI